MDQNSRKDTVDERIILYYCGDSYVRGANYIILLLRFLRTWTVLYYTTAEIPVYAADINIIVGALWIITVRALLILCASLDAVIHR